MVLVQIKSVTYTSQVMTATFVWFYIHLHFEKIKFMKKCTFLLFYDSNKFNYAL